MAPNVEHLQLIQAVITRMAGNSFLLKGWSVSLVAGLSALSKSEGNRSFAWIALSVIVVFAFLDAYYLALEKAYRRLYNEAAAGQITDFSLSATLTSQDVLDALRSVATVALHGALVAGAIAVALTS